MTVTVTGDGPNIELTGTGSDITITVTTGGGGGGGVTDHGALTGLADDDHTQYALADGSRGDFAATSHTHAASDVTSGAFDAARLATGTATDGYVITSDGGTPTWEAPASGSSGIPVARHGTSSYMVPNGLVMGSGGTQATVADTMYFGLPFPLHTDITITAVRMRLITAASAGGTARIGVYQLPSSGDINGTLTLVADLGTIATDVSAPAYLTLTGLSAALTAGANYCFAFVQNANASYFQVPMQASSGAIGDVTTYAAGSLAMAWSYKAQAYGALPATASGLTFVDTNNITGLRNLIAAKWSET